MPLVVTKLDLPEVRERLAESCSRSLPGVHRRRQRPRRAPALTSCAPRLATALDEATRSSSGPAADEERVVHRFDPLDEGWQVVADGDGLRVQGRRIETAAARTDFENDESRDRFWRLLERLGIDAELRRHGAGPGTTVHIGSVELEWGDETR